MATASHNETIIAQGVTVEGDFASQGDVSIDGEVKGTVQAAQLLRVGETARIHADVKAGSAVVAGEIEGNILVNDRLELTESSRIHGDVTAKVLSIAAGAIVNGRVTMGAAGRPSAQEEE